VGVLRYTRLNDPIDNYLVYTTWKAGVWASLLTIGTGITTRTAPSLDAGATGAALAFQGTDYKHYFSPFNGTIWGVVEGVGPGSFGPSGPSIAASGADATVAFFDGGNGNNLTARERLGGAWQPQVSIAGGSNFNLPPAIVDLSSGPQRLVVYVKSGGQISFASRTAGVWSAVVDIPSAFTSDPPALAATAGGGAVLAFRGSDGKLYTSFYAAGAWSAVAPFSTPNVTLAAPPAVAHGAGSALAEIAFVTPDGKASHARYLAGAWTSPVVVGGSNLGGVTLGAAP
jgi:hypothetical protein